MAANGYQKHILIGNLGADPKVHTTQNGNFVTNFDIAVNERNADGTEIVTWYGIAAWNGLGEVCAEYLKKGRQVMVEGTRLEATAWFGRDNNLYTKMELTANEVKFLGNGNGNGNGNGQHSDEPQPARQRPAQSRPEPRRVAQPQHGYSARTRTNRSHFIPDNPEDIKF